MKIFIGAVPWPEVKKSAEISEQISERRNFTYNSRFIYPPTVSRLSILKYILSFRSGWLLLKKALSDV